MIGFGETIADKAKLVFKLNTGAAVLGLGYIIGLKYASIICLGSLTIWWVIVPGMALIFPDTVLNQWDPSITTALGNMSAEEIYQSYARSIGIGGIAMSGIIGIVKSWGIIKDAVGLAAREMKRKGCRPARSDSHAARYFFQDYRHWQYLNSDYHFPFLLFRCHGLQFVACSCWYYPCCRDSFSLHNGSGQCHCHCGVEPCFGNDADDFDSRLCCYGGRRIEAVTLVCWQPC